jgi:predicted transcriptional regulator YdeE
MSCELIEKSFGMTGIERRCLFKEYPVAMAVARTTLNERISELPNAGETELIMYAMTEESVHPERKERFYFGRMTDRTETLPDGFVLAEVRNQWFVSTVYKGPIRDIWKGYNEIRDFMHANSLAEDKASYVIELYDRRFDPDSDVSEMEIFMPVIK